LLLVRHPLDALISLYMQSKYRVATQPYAGSIVDFCHDPVFGIEKFIRYYQLWSNSVGDTSTVLLWRYEDARQNPVSSLRRIIHFLELPLSERCMEEAAEFTSFESMKRMEQSGNEPVYRSSGFGIFATGDRSNPDSFHVRKGKVGGYYDDLPPDAIIELQKIIKMRMPDYYGYER
jgi:Sulfotransferase domain